MKILVTGGCGYIGSHTAVELLEKGYEVVIVDNLINSNKDVITKIEKITNKKVKFYKADLLNKKKLDQIFEVENFDSVIHFAGLKAVGESVKVPLIYYNNNIIGTINLLEVMAKHKVNKIVFSSSACVYGNPEKLPITESSPLFTTNPYGATKLMIEGMLKDVAYANKDLCSVILRYFNPIGAHSSGLIGENPNGIPNNLAPYIAQVAKGKREFLSVFGDDYKTPDGTGVRDYIHVVDLALGHIAALENIKTAGTFIYNLGTGKGTSVLELLRAFENAYKKTIPYKICARREGDIDACYADCSKAKKELGWIAKYDIDNMCKSIFNFESKL